MNFSCSICAELFRGPDAHNLHVTKCGHVFHNGCLAKWLERKNTCPECRSKTTSTNVMRLYVNIVDSTYDESVDGPPDLVGLQNENDNLKFRLIEKDGAIKSKEEAIKRLEGEKDKMLSSAKTARELMLTLEHQLEYHKVIVSQKGDEIKALKTRVNEIHHLREKLKEANDKMKTAELVQHLITSTQQETEELLKEGRTMIELATMVTTLKRELRNCNTKRAQARSNAEELSKQLKLCKDEKIKLEEKCSILESKLFQLESNRENKNDSSDRLNITDNVTEKQSPVDQQSAAKRKFGEHLSLPRKVARLDITRNVSPSMCVKASSIAGLSPLLKRTKSAEMHKLSPVNDEKTETFSILKKPRLIQNQSKKSELRPLRLNKVPTLSSVNEATTSSSEPIQPTQSKELPSNSLSGKFASLNNRFRLGSLSKPN